jgi:DNA-binding response OmpR family regulator
VVDDEPMVSETVTLVLQVDGHTVETASNAKEALAIFSPGKFDIVITDFLMPGWTGDQLAAAIKIRCTNQLVFMLTAFPEKVRRQVPLLMVDLLLGKPFDIGEIRAAIHLFTSARAA